MGTVPPSPIQAMCFQPALCETVLYSPERGGWLWFRRPRVVLSTERLADVPALLQEIDRQVNCGGKFAAGFLSYEAAPAFDEAFRVRTPERSGLPLLWFGIYDGPVFLSPTQLTTRADLPGGPWLPDISQLDYKGAIQQIKDAIARGDTYQVNFTYRLHAELEEPAWPIFATLAGAHAAPYAAYLETEAWAICSISPELFFSLDGEVLTSRPMKGTARRGLTLDDDHKLAEWLHHSEKNRAENVMIVDMVRNDIGRIARIGSVCVPELFKIEKYPTVWQMTSTVQAETRASLFEILQALFPAASITGAPKIRTMQIITELENSPRRVYTGAIGYFAPARKAQFNVAIRTLLVDKLRRDGEYGVGGGIVWDSEAISEWEETIIKARIFSECPQPFDLLESMRWTPEEGWFLIEQHLERLKRSAEYFSYRFDPCAMRSELARVEVDFQGIPQKVRLTVSKDGEIDLQHAPLTRLANPAEIGIARSPVSSNDRFLYHKTTRRGIYRKALAECPGFEDVILWNERGEVTESCIANVVVELDGELLTPPVESGLLSGTYRAWLLEQGKVKERRILLSELERCSQVYLVNSVRGMWKVGVCKKD